MEATSLVELESAGKKLGKWMVEEGKNLYRVKDKVEGLQSELEWIQCFLKSADGRKKDDEMARKWISEINDFSYEAEDIVEKYLLKVSHPRNSEGIWDLMKWMVCVCAREGKSTYQVGCEIDALTCKISKLASRMITYGVTPTSVSVSMPMMMMMSMWDNKKAELRRAHSHLPVDENHVVGLEEDARILVDQLMNKRSKVIGISGMAGLGKTTLARKVYQHVKGHQFEKCAWIYVSQKFQPTEVILQILLKLYEDDKPQRKQIEHKPVGELQGTLYRVLEQNKCLVVLDDVWKCSDWDYLKHAFPINTTTESRTKLLITSRSRDLIYHVDPLGFPHQLHILNAADSLKLFYKKASPPKDITCKELGVKMVAQCKGLPLAIVVLGGILAPKKTVEEWTSVYKNIETYLIGKNDEGMGVTDVLELSYTDLPYHLRPCFLHLGNFPEDFEIPTKKLYRMWIAEGIVAPRNDNKLVMKLEDTANSYLHELVQRCIVQVSKIGPARKIKSCRLHDLMWEMCTSKGKEENFLCNVRQESMNNNVGLFKFEKMHRVSIHFGQNVQSVLPAQFGKASHLRSLMFFSSSAESNDGKKGCLQKLIKQLKLLRVLDLENTGIKEMFREIGTLIHLRYLSIMGTQVRELPSSIGNLRCLQTLDLGVSLPNDDDEQCVIVRIPNVLWRMKSLKHLYLPSNAYRVKRFQIKRLQKLRVHGLRNLEILKNFDTRRTQVTDLRKLDNLRKLSIKNNISKTKTLKAIMECQSIKNDNLVHLYLKIHIAILNFEPTILSSCSCLHTLQMETTTNSARENLRLESVKFPGNLKILAIKNCNLMCSDPMQNLKHLPKLRSLSLENVWFSGTSMDCSDQGFLQLVDLKLDNMISLREWKVAEQSMPKLCRLQVPDGLPTSVQVVCSLFIVYVDGLNIIGTPKELERTAKYLMKEFEMKELGRTKFCLGLQIEYLKEGIFVH